jgi:hypothetical protein
MQRRIRKLFGQLIEAQRPIGLIHNRRPGNLRGKLGLGSVVLSRGKLGEIGRRFGKLRLTGPRLTGSRKIWPATKTAADGWKSFDAYGSIPYNMEVQIKEEHAADLTGHSLTEFDVV